MSSLIPRNYPVVCFSHSYHCWTDNKIRILIQEKAKRNNNFGTLTLVEIGLNFGTLLQILLTVLAIVVTLAHNAVISFKV